jgi:enterochelin esterase-like enzyme
MVLMSATAPITRAGRRRFLGACVAAAAGLALGRSTPAAAALPPAGSGLWALPADEAPFDLQTRHSLAEDALTYFVRQQGLFPGRFIQLLPAAPWFGGHEPVATRRAWDMSLPAGQALYLLAYADPNGPIDPAEHSVTVNGLALPDLGAYVHGGIRALHAGRVTEHAVLDLIFAPPAPGRYTIEVRSRVTPPAPFDGRGDELDRSGETDGGWSAPAIDETVLAYDITVQPPDALGPLLLRGPDGRVFATQGGTLRHVKDLATLAALGYPAGAVASASAAALALLPEGDPLPALRDGMLVRADNHPAVFRLQGGKRAWLKGLVTSGTADDDSDVRLVEAAVLSTIPPVLQEDMLLKGRSADLYHVERGALRKAPDHDWVTLLGLQPEQTLFVPDRIIATLPQNSPHWVTPGGTSEDHTFHSATLGRQMPYRVYLPPGYHTPARAAQRYQTIYLLHGMGGRYDEWSGYGLEEVANQLLRSGEFSHSIVVMPQGGLGYWMNQVGGVAWADYVARDLVPHIDAVYRTIAAREARAVGGLSMGGHGAIQLALNYPDLFGIAGAHSPSIRGQDIAPAYFGTGADFAERDPVALVAGSRLADPPRIWIDAGEDDPWRETAEGLHAALLDRGWTHEWHLYPGEHDGWYWGDHIWDYLPFYAQAFASNGVPAIREAPPAS